MSRDVVLYYNPLLLSRVYDQKLASGDHAAADIVKDISPNAWQHVHLIGAFIPEELLVHLSPLKWEHINLTGDYHWRRNGGHP